MFWESTSTYPKTITGNGFLDFCLDWRCKICGEKCSRVGKPEIRIQSQYVRGGELLTFECKSGHKQAIEGL